MKALIIVDLQNDFMPNGALAVKHALAVLPIANALMQHFDYNIATQDWHPADHLSFASQHPGKRSGDQVRIAGNLQVLWPDHCVQNTKGAEFVDGLDVKKVWQIVHKGINREIDSYSAFFDNAHLRSTGLEQTLRDLHVTDVYIVGVATDYCVKFTALDAVDLGFKTHVVVDGCRGVELLPGDVQKALDEMKDAGAKLLLSKDFFKAESHDE